MSDIEENTQVVGKYARTFKKGNIESLKNELENMINYTQENKEKIANYVLNTYNWDKIVKETEKIYAKE